MNATQALRDDVIAIYRAAIAAVDPMQSVQRAILLDTKTRLLTINAAQVDVGDAGIYGIALGKAAVSMMNGLIAATGDLFTAGLAVTKNAPHGFPARTRVLLGSHPVPDQQSLDAGQAIFDFARAIPTGAVVFCLISGGGSALAEVLQPGITLRDLRETTRTLLGGGAAIGEINAVRSRLSAFKGGGLLAQLSHTTLVNLLVSDVLGDDPCTIASGPSVPPEQSIAAESVLSRYGIELTLPPLQARGAPIPRTTQVVASLRTAVLGAADAAQALGYQPCVLTTSADGEAREMGRLFAAMVADSVLARTHFSAPTCLVAGGESVVHLRGDGIGGRNTEAALAAAIRLSGVPDCAIGFLATDGDDGVSGAAGGIVDGATVNAENRLAAQQALEANDSFPFLDSRNAALSTGPSGTNVNDLMIAVIR